MTRHEDAQNDSKNKTIIDFNNDDTTSIILVAIHKTLTVNLTTHFMKEKMLKFSKTSPCSFVYGMIDAFCFLLENQAVKSIYEKHKIQEWFINQNLANSDSTSLFVCFFLFLFVT